MTNPLGDLISRGEGGYNSYNRGTSDGHILPASQKVDFSQMTLDELQRRQALPKVDQDRIFAVGKYQMVPKTLAKAVADLNLSGSERFSPEMQERIFAECLIVGKRPQIANYIKGLHGATLHDAQKATCQEWASVDDPDTPGKPYKRYEQQGNHASIRAGQVATALNEMREAYKADIAHGMSPQDAWRSVTGQVGPSKSMPVSQHQPETSPRHPEHHDQHVSPSAQPVLRQGDNGPHVTELQQTLSHLNYRTPTHHPLVIDGHFGADTRHAVEAFQRELGLHVDGVVGKDTRSVLAATQANPFTGKYHPHHALYEQALHQVHVEESHRHIQSGPHSEALAGALTVAAANQGLSRIDRVQLNDAGTLVRAIQVSPIRDEPGLNHATMPIDTQQAMHTPLLHSSEQLQQAPRHHDVPSHVQASPSMAM